MKMIRRVLLVVSFLSLLSCVREELDFESVPPVSGDEILFGVTPGNFGPDTKTVYGVADGENFKNYTKLTIDWRPGEDELRVYCPQAEAGSEYADYVVQNDATVGNYLQKLPEFGSGVRWGDLSEAHEFYAFYPKSVGREGSLNFTDIEGLKSSTVVTATIPVAQERGQLLDASNTPEISTVDPNWKIIAPNMSYCMMAGRGTWTPGQDKNVSLSFKPLVTVLDVVVNGPDDGISASGVVSVSVRSRTQPIVGQFSYDVATGEFTMTEDEYTNKDNTIATVDCMYNAKSITLAPGEKLNVKFFLLPRDINAGELSVSVLLDNGKVLTQDLMPDGGDGPDLLQGRIIKVQTPKLKVAETSNWMSLINDKVLFASQLSLPGSKHSYTFSSYESEKNSYNADNGIMQSYQTLDISEQFDAGIRVFDIKINTNLRGGTKGTAYIYSGTDGIRQNGRYLTLGDLIDDLYAKISVSPSEFAIISINYVGHGGDLSTEAPEWLRNIENAVSVYSGILKEVTPATTVGDMRGGIGIMVHYPTGYSGNSSYLNIIPGYSSSVQNLDIVDYSIAGVQGTVSFQNLQHVNNPDLGIYPYFITELNATEGTSMDLIQTKKDLISKLLTRAEGSSGTNSLFVNDLGGFCVVNDESSTGYITGDWYECNSPLDWGFTWRWQHQDEINLTRYDRSQYTYFFDLGESVDVPDASRNHSGETYFVVDNKDGSSTGQGGNNALFAQEINGYASDAIYNLVDQGRTPLGVVYISFAGTDQVTFNGRTYDVHGVQLPSLIMSNNFKFELETKPE